jgi:hypothetical protein
MMQCLASPETEFWEIPVFDVHDQHVLVTGPPLVLIMGYRLSSAARPAKP